MKVVISGRRMSLFVNGATSPTLAVGSLAGDAQEGDLTLLGPGAFANLKVTPDAVEGLAESAEPDPTAGDRQLVRDWRLAPFSELPDGNEPAIADLPEAVGRVAGTGRRARRTDQRHQGVRPSGQAAACAR